MFNLPLFGMGLLFALSASAAHAHEFWIEPEAYQIAPGEAIVAAIRVGEEFEGTSYSYIPANFRRFDFTQDGDVRNVPGRAGDRPAANVLAEKPGLTVLIHVTRDYELTYDSWDNFVRFVTSKGAEWALQRHAERVLPEEGPTEGYSRYAKSLVAVGDGAGEDRRFGLLTEIVALENPYTGEIADGVDVQVFYDGSPRGDAQVDVFAKTAEGDVTVEKVMTDANGIATVPVAPGSSYLVDAVVVREAGAELVESMEAEWESLWASLTFAVPDGR